MKKLNLYLDFEFTSLSPDAQPISIGIVSDEINQNELQENLRNGEINLQKFLEDATCPSKSFCAEFTDFDISRCDDWVKENVVSKLKFKSPALNGITSGELSNWKITDNSTEICADTQFVKEYLHKWLSQFYDYQIQIVVDCGTWDWYHFLQLVAEWDNKELETEDENVIWNWLNPIGFEVGGFEQPVAWFNNRIGLPKLPSNISPVPQDLNDIIAIKKGISPKEAFDLNREVLAFGRPDLAEHEKHNSLFDAKIIKVNYQKLMQ